MTSTNLRLIFLILQNVFEIFFSMYKVKKVSKVQKVTRQFIT